MKIVFSVFDKKAEVYGLPFFMAAPGEAVRAFEDLARDQKTTVFRHPEDFKLVRLGSFDEKSGEFVSETPVTLAHADEFRVKLAEVPHHE